MKSTGLINVRAIFQSVEIFFCGEELDWLDFNEAAPIFTAFGEWITLLGAQSCVHMLINGTCFQLDTREIDAWMSISMGGGLLTRFGFTEISQDGVELISWAMRGHKIIFTKQNFDALRIDFPTSFH